MFSSQHATPSHSSNPSRIILFSLLALLVIGQAFSDCVPALPVVSPDFTTTDSSLPSPPTTRSPTFEHPFPTGAPLSTPTMPEFSPLRIAGTSTALPIGRLTSTPEPLNASGPWLFLGNLGMLSTVWWIADLDLSHFSLLESWVPPPGDWSWWVKPAPQGGYLLLGANDQGEPLLETGEAGFDYQMWLVQMPSLAVVRRIPLLSRQTRIRIRQEIAADPVSLPIPLAFARSFPALWSPDGRYLAFSAALERPNEDIYLYDVASNLILRLTNVQHDALVRSWSPDSKWIVYEQMAGTCDPLGLQSGCIPKGVGVVSRYGTDLHLYVPQAPEAFLGWISVHAFVVHQIALDGPPTGLRVVDIFSGKAQELYNDAFGDVAFDPESGAMMLNLSTGPFWHYSGEAPGLYRWEPATASFVQVLPGDYIGIEWLPQMGLFLTSQANGPPYEIILLDVDGQVQLRLPDMFSPWNIQPSPDGKWLLVLHASGYQLYNARGMMILKLGPGRVLWQPDAQAFYFLLCQDGGGALYHYRLDLSWRSTLLADMIPACLDMGWLNP